MTAAQVQLADWLAALDGWSTVATWTFGKQWPLGPTPEAVRYHVGRWIEDRSIAQAFYVAEAGTSGTRRWHAHGLLSLDPDFWPRQRHHSLWKSWSRRYGRCLFTPLDPNGGITRYVSKYCLKTGARGVNRHLP